MYGKYLYFPLFRCEPVTSIKSKVTLFREEEGRRKEREGPVGGRHGGGRGGSTVVKPGTELRRAATSFPATLRPGAGTLLDPRVSCLQAHPSESEDCPGLRYAPCTPRCGEGSLPPLHSRSTAFFAQLCRAGALDPAKLSCHLELRQSASSLGENVNFWNHTPFWLICLSCSKDSFIKYDN